MLAVPRSGLDQSSFQLNVQACRLVLDILPGLEVAVLNETDGLVTQVLMSLSYPNSIYTLTHVSVHYKLTLSVPQLYKWIACKEEPLASYAIGLLALAMELNEVATITIVITDQYDCVLGRWPRTRTSASATPSWCRSCWSR